MSFLSFISSMTGIRALAPLRREEMEKRQERDWQVTIFILYVSSCSPCKEH